jgi:CheY-like chemotaxis protein
MTKVLYVEDHEAQRDIVGRVLELHGGYEVDVACSGEKGMRKTREWHPHVVLKAMRMRGRIDSLAAIPIVKGGNIEPTTEPYRLIGFRLACRDLAVWKLSVPTC